MEQKKVVITFDLYGTLLSTESIALKLAEFFGEDRSGTLAALWRRYQLEYTWRSNSTQQYRGFSDITRSALEHTLTEHGLRVSGQKVDQLMRAYDSLQVFPEVPRALAMLRDKMDLVDAYVFSNGTDEMVANSVRLSPDLEPHADVFRSLVTVEPVKAFKPDLRVYEHLAKEVGRQGNKSDVWLVTANPFDVVGSKVAGMKAAFVDRAGKGWVDRLDTINVPSIIAGNVEGAVKSILHWEEEKRQN